MVRVRTRDVEMGFLPGRDDREIASVDWWNADSGGLCAPLGDVGS